jgi:hypothetical protein
MPLANIRVWCSRCTPPLKAGACAELVTLGPNAAVARPALGVQGTNVMAAPTPTSWPASPERVADGVKVEVQQRPDGGRKISGRGLDPWHPRGRSSSSRASVCPGADRFANSSSAAGAVCLSQVLAPGTVIGSIRECTGDNDARAGSSAAEQGLLIISG